MLDYIVNYYWIVIILGLFRIAIYCNDKNRKKENLETIINYKNKKFIKYMKSIYFDSEARLDKLLNIRNEFKEAKFKKDFNSLKNGKQLLLSIKVEQTINSFDTSGLFVLTIALLGAFFNLLPNVLAENTTETNDPLILLIFIVCVILYLVIVGESFNIKANKAKLVKQYIDYYSQINAEEEKKGYQKSLVESQKSMKEELKSITGDVSKISKTIESISKNKKDLSSQPSLIKSLLKFIFIR